MAALLLELHRHLRRACKRKPPVIWFEANACSGDSISLMNAVGPDLVQILFSIVDVRYDNALMAAEGEYAKRALEQAVRESPGRYVLMVEGAIPLNAGGRFAIVSWGPGPLATGSGPTTAAEVLAWLAPLAGRVIAVGTCATHGGPSAARPNPSGSVGTSAFLAQVAPGTRAINVTGCPAHPDWTVATLAHVLMYGDPDLDKAGRPLFLYGETVHRNCQRRSYFDRGEFAEWPGGEECMFQVGCMGPVTHSDCPYRLWNAYVNWPVKASTPCIGCTTPEFPDGSMPFFAPLSSKREMLPRDDDGADGRNRGERP
jgi:hydrogenase small subunit